MEEKITLKKVAKELSTIIPALGVFLADSRIRKGDTPLIFENPNASGKSNLEILAENEKNLWPEERKILRYRENKLKTIIFIGYHVITTSFIFYKLFCDTVTPDSYLFPF